MGEVGKEIRRLREARGWGQTKLAAAADMAVSGVSQIENGHRNPNSATLIKLARALEVEVADLFPKGQAPLPDFERDPRMEQRREFLEHIKTLDRAALTALSEKIDEEYMRVWTEWERAKESGAPETARLSTELVDVGTRGFMARLQMRIVDNPDASFTPAQQQRTLVGAA